MFNFVQAKISSQYATHKFIKPSKRVALVLFLIIIYNHNFYRSLQWLRGSNKSVELELETIRSNIRTSRLNTDNNLNSNLTSISQNGLPTKYSFKTILTNIKSVLKNTRLVKPVLITCGLMVFQRFTGNQTLENFKKKSSLNIIPLKVQILLDSTL